MSQNPFPGAIAPIRPLQKSDRPSFQAWAETIQSSAPEFYWDHRTLVDCFDSNLCWGLWMRGELAAAVCVLPSPDSWEILWLATDPEYRGQGLMTQLLRQLVVCAKSHEVPGEGPPQQIILEVHERNQKALQLYASLGFCQVGRRKNYYRDGAEALVMSLKLE